MGNLSEEQMKRVFMGVLVLAGLVGLAWYLLLAPQKQDMTSERGKINTLKDQIREAEAAIKQAEAIATETNAANAEFESIIEDVPRGAPIAWVPPRINNYWRRQEFPDVTTEPSGIASINNPALAGFEKRVWQVTINDAPFVDFGIALSEFENKEILMQLTSLNVSASAEQPETQNITFTLQQILPENEDA
jgi:hypothetical protein